MDGGASAGSADGWDIGLYAHAEGDGNATQPGGPTWTYNFNSGFDVSTYRSGFRDFKLSGIVAATYSEGRGSIDLNSSTYIRNSGPGQSPAVDLYNGIHMFSFESYLALTGTGAQSDGNAGNGIWLNFGGEHGAHHGVPEGLYVGLNGCASHGNGRNGISMRAASSDLNPVGLVGGTTHQDINGNLHRVAEHEGFVQLFGTGFVHGCAISNNALSGIYALIEQGGFTGPNDKCATASARLTNNVIWNNASGGITIEFDDRDSDAQNAGGLCLLPVTHCTLANNGPWSAEVIDAETSGGTFEVDNAPFDNTTLRTRVFDSAMFRDVAVSPGPADFGTRLEALARFDDNISAVSTDYVGMAGNRAVSAISIPPPLTDEKWTTAGHAFVGPFSMTSWSPFQFHLDLAAATIGSFRDSTPYYLNVFAPLSSVDFDGDARPAVSSTDRDKGADEIP